MVIKTALAGITIGQVNALQSSTIPLITDYGTVYDEVMRPLRHSLL